MCLLKVVPSNCPNTTLSKLSSLPAKSGTFKYDSDKCGNVLAKSGTFKYCPNTTLSKLSSLLAKSGTFK
jgi:hypothetical protein